MLSVSLLGDLRIRHDGVAVAGLDTPRLQSLLAYLLLHRDAPQSRAHLAFLFWPDTDEAQARTNLRNLLHYLRRCLPAAGSYIDAGPQTLQWRPGAPLTLDVAEFHRALAQAAQAPPGSPAACAALEQAVELCKGDLLPSCYDDWIIAPRESLRQEYAAALETLARLHEERRDYHGAIAAAQRLLRHDPLHEEASRRLIRLHALNGDRAGALRAYHACATALRRELGVEPGVATRQAYELLLGAELHWPAPSPQAGGFASLVGREAEWASLLQSWRAAAAGGEPHLAALRGEAGIGKTRLVEELLQWADRQGIASLYTRCYAAEGELAYAPVAAWLRSRPLAALEPEWLAEVSRLLPEILTQQPSLPRPAPITQAWQRRQLFEALSRAVLGLGRPLLLAIDDLQWCDRDTLEWLHFVLRYDREARLLVAGGYRPEEVTEEDPLATLLRALESEGRATIIDLFALDEPDTRTLAARAAGAEIGEDAARRIYRETEGNPLFVIETVRAGLAQRWWAGNPGAPRPSLEEPSSQPAGLPPRVQATLAARLAQLTPPARELAELAAVIGREFSFSLLAAASGLDEESLVRLLDQLWQRRIVREQGAEAYDFGHDKLREVAYGGLSAARRRRLHHLAARALETVHGGDLDAVSSRLAAHFERAGMPSQALPYYLRAAGVARRVFANEEAMALLRRGLAVAARQGPEGNEGGRDGDMPALLLEELGDIQELGARHDEALQSYAAALARRAGGQPVSRARLLRKSGAAKREQRLYAEALDCCRRAESALGETPAGSGGAWWAEWLEVRIDRIWAHYWLAQWPEMESIVQSLQPVALERGGPVVRLRFLLARCLLHLRKDRYRVSDELLDGTREALALSLEHGDVKTRIECRFEVGFLLLWRRDLAEAGEHVRAALEMAETAGALPILTLGLTYLTVLSRFLGRAGEAAAYAPRARQAAEAAHMPDYSAAAEGNLAWLAWRRRDLGAAEDSARQALAIWRRSPLVYPFQSLALWPLLGIALERGSEDEAWTLAEALMQPTQQRLPEPLDSALASALRAREEGMGGAGALLRDAALSARGLGYL